jgi:hypothetical protein
MRLCGRLQSHQIYCKTIKNDCFTINLTGKTNMFDPAQHLIQATGNEREAAYSKLRRAALLMRGLLLAYVVYSFLRFVPWWLNKADIESWQRWLGLSVNLISWLSLVGAVWMIGRFFDCFREHKTLTHRGGQYLMRCAWFACVSQLSNMLARPMTRFILNADFEPNWQHIDWALTTRDPLAIVLCFALLMFAYMHRWMLTITQENAAFV